MGETRFMKEMFKLKIYSWKTLLFVSDWLNKPAASHVRLKDL